jgi:hypothetical protein
MTNDPFDLQLAELATAVAFPPTPDLATAVGLRLRTEQRKPVVIRSFRRSLLLAALLALLVVGAALAVGFGLRLLSIEFGPVSSPTFSPGTELRLGQALSLEQVEDAADFEVLVPQALGAPDAAYVSSALRGQVAFVYAPRPDLPPSDLLGGAGLLITQNQGRADEGLAHKVVESSAATVVSVDVNGAPGLWISGAPHIFWYLAPDGRTFIQESGRLVGDTLAWERDGILYRIEGAITIERALEIAASMR